MFSNTFFFTYIFAGFAGLLAICLAIVLIRNWTAGNKPLLIAMCNFLICSAAIDAVYFYLDYINIVKGQYETNTLLRVFDILLFVGQVYFWTKYMRIKADPQGKKSGSIGRTSLIFIVICMVLAVAVYGFMMDGYYLVPGDKERMYAVLMECVIGILLTIANIWNLCFSLKDIVQRNVRRYISVITVMLVANGIWNAFLVIGIMGGRLERLVAVLPDPTAVFFLIINVVALLLITCEDFTALFEAPVQNPESASDETRENEENIQNSKLQQRLEYIAQIHSLTEREREIMVLAYERMTNPEIAETLCVSKYTVKNHMHNIFEKLDISTRAELIAMVNDKKDTQ